MGSATKARRRLRRALAHTCAAAVAVILPLASTPYASAQGYPVGGAILDEYEAAALHNGQSTSQFFGPATTAELDAARGGRWQEFANTQNSIYWHPLVSNARANQIGGAIRAKWGTIGYENGPARYPTTRETSTRTSSQGNSGSFNHFENGHSIYWNRNNDTAVHIHGEIRRQWEASDWESGPLGFPIRDEMVCFGPENSVDDLSGRAQYFESGWLLWSTNSFRANYRAAPRWRGGTLPEMSFATQFLSNESHKQDFRDMLGRWNSARPFNFWENNETLADIRFYDVPSSDLSDDLYGRYDSGSLSIDMFPDKIYRDGGTYASTALHELGHALGLGHSCELNIMGPAAPYSSALRREVLGRIDTYEVQQAWRR